MTTQNQEKPAQSDDAVGSALMPLGKSAGLMNIDEGQFANLLDTAKFEHMWRVATIFSRSKMVPQHFQGQPENCFIATQMAVRLGVDPFMFMQKTYVTNGKPAMEAQMAIALINARGPFKGPIQYRLEGEGDDRRCTAYQVHKVTGERCECTVSIRTAKAEGWYERNHKWRNMTDMMLCYRAAAWFGRLYAPECLMGMLTEEEAQDLPLVKRIESTSTVPDTQVGGSKADCLAARVRGSQPKPADHVAETPAADHVAETPSGEPAAAAPADGSISRHEQLTIMLAERCGATLTDAAAKLDAFARKLHNKPFAKLADKALDSIEAQIKSGDITL